MGEANDNNLVNGFDVSDDTTLLLGNEEYSQHQSDIYEAENKLVFDTSAYDLENDVCGTEAMCTLSKYWHMVVDVGDSFRNFTCNDVDQLFTDVQASINTTAKDTGDNLTTNSPE